MTTTPSDPAGDRTKLYGVLDDEARILTARRLKLTRPRTRPRP